MPHASTSDSSALPTRPARAGLFGGPRGAAVFAMAAAATVLSQFFRTSNGVIAPELMADTGLGPAGLGLVNGAFFVVLAAAQIPVGMAFDRFGPRRTIAALTGVAVAGTVAFGFATSVEGLLLGRVLIGLGCAGSFMGAVVLCARWYPPDRFTTVISWVFASSNLGTLMAATPLAAASSAFGWRTAFFGMAAITAIVGVLFLLLVRDAPAQVDAAEREPEPLGAVLRGVAEVWRTPGLLPVLALHTVAYASMLTVLGLWGGPYLHDVHGLDGVARGNVLFAMGAAQILGLLIYGPLDRVFGTRKRVVAAGAAAAVVTLALLALLPSPPAWLAAGLMVLLGCVSAYTIVIVAHGRSLFPDRLVGRGVTTVNVAQALGCAGLPMLSGLVVGAFPATAAGAPEIAYRAAFGFLAMVLAVGLASYARSTDRPPG